MFPLGNTRLGLAFLFVLHLGGRQNRFPHGFKNKIPYNLSLQARLIFSNYNQKRMIQRDGFGHATKGWFPEQTTSIYDVFIVE